MKIIEKFYEENKLGRIFILHIPSYIISLLGLVIILDDFQTADKDTTYLTNYGFAILIGFASICFSWARNMDREKEPKMLDEVSIAGEKSFHSAILFLMGSGIKYILINLTIYIESSAVLYCLHIFFYVIYLACFAIAYIKFESVIRDLNFLLHKRLNQKTKQ